MPIIQMSLECWLTDDKAADLGAEVVEVVHSVFGSAKAHINVVVRHAGGSKFVEASMPTTPTFGSCAHGRSAGREGRGLTTAGDRHGWSEVGQRQGGVRADHG
ncbi:hypothetical protein [Mycobacteroides abscessus]|uniref:hypothetical protein n=1 Tax=Mycobacteroides abscessus TaxID=36809 RepID=UPI000925BB5A|nr:hypothetical protein [Mycobacteroides abscessus]SHQ38653.1 Uncharacterised protein [Mycobacteroides abscessus subsp. abscessus]